MSEEEANLRFFCFACRLLRAEIGEPHPRGPCPKCGNDILAGYKPGEEFNLIAGGFRLVSKPPKGGRWDAESVSKHSYFTKTKSNHFINRVINRVQDRYQERIVDVETGQVVREVDEPLTHHKSRGSARKKKKDETDT
jgi:hypothetical protein